MTTTQEAPPRVRKLYTPGAVGLFFSADEDLSLADEVATLSEEEREFALAGADMRNLQWDQKFWLRPSQLALVNSEHWMTVALAGRGWGKSRVLSVAMHKYAMEHPGSRLLLLGRTTSDVRDVMIHGESGVMNVVSPDEAPRYNPANRRLTWANGTIALCYSAERPDALRGVQAHASFCDEVAAYRSNGGAGLASPFDQVKVLTRLGENPQIFVATTPKRVPQIIELVAQAEREPNKVLIVRGPTRANRALSNTYRETVEGLYEGTALGKQELEGELLTDVEGALLTQDVINDNRYALTEDEQSDPKWWMRLRHRVVGVDPSVSSKPNDECGIVVVGATGQRKLHERHAYVLEDASILGSPDEWARRVVKMARKYRALVVAEKNQGGELVRSVIKGVDAKVPVVLVHAKLSKEERAEPVGTAYERGAVHHVDWWPELEAQLTGWAPDMGMPSPDRLDAVVWAVQALLVKKPEGATGPMQMSGGVAGRQITGVQSHNPADRYPEDHVDAIAAYERVVGHVQTAEPEVIVEAEIVEPASPPPRPARQPPRRPAERQRALLAGRYPAVLSRGSYLAPNRFGRRYG